MAGGYDGEIRIRTLIENGDASSSLLQMEAKFQKLAKEATKLNDGMREIEKRKIPTEEYKEMQDYLEKATEKLSKLNDRMYKFEDLGGNTNSKAFKSMRYDAEQLESTIKEVRKALREMRNSGTDYVDPKGTAEYQQKAEKLREVREQMDILNQKMNEVAAKESKVGSGSKQIEKVGKAAKKTAGLMSTLLSRLKGITLSLFIFNWITKGFNAMVAAFKEGIQNMAKYSGDFNSKMSEMKSATATLKASLGTLAAPIVSAIVPAIVTLCNWLTTAINKINMLISALSGKSTWTRAKKQQVDYAKSLNSTAAAAKKAAGALQGFDELNVINSNSDSGGGSGADASTLYEEVPTSNSLIKKLQPFLDFLKEIQSAVKKGWKNTWKSLDIDKQIGSIKRSLASIKKSFADIFGSPEVGNAAKNFVLTLANSIGQIGASIVSIGATIAQNLLGGLATYLKNNTQGIKQYLVKMFDIAADISSLAGQAMEAFAYVFQAFGDEDGQQITANLLQIFSDAFGAASTVVAGLADDLLHLLIDPFVNNQEGLRTALEGLLSVVADVTGTISETVGYFCEGIVSLYEEHIHPLIQSLTDGISSIAEKFLEFWNTYAQPILDNIAQKFHEVMEQHIQPLIDSFLNVIATVIDNIKYLWENCIQPFIEWVIENILPVLAPIFNDIVEGILNIIGLASDLVSDVMDFLSGLIDFIVGVFNKDWEKAWTGIREMFSAIWKAIKDLLGTILSDIEENIFSTLNFINGGWRDAWTKVKEVVLAIFDGIVSGIKEKINSIISFVENMANSVVSGINTVINALNSVGFDMPDWLGGGSFRLDIPTLSTVSIPRLANGGITTGSTLANIGEAGREAVLPLENNLGYLEPLAEMIASKMEGVQMVRVVPDKSNIFKVVREEANGYYRRTGKPAFNL